LQWAASSPLKIAPSHGNPDPHLIHGSLDPPESSTQWAALYPQNSPFPWGIWAHLTYDFMVHIRAHSPDGILIGVAVFLTAHRRMSLYFTMSRPFPSKLPLPMAYLDSHLIRGSLGPPTSSTRTASRSVEPFYRAHYCERPTDHATQSVTVGRIYVRTTAMRPNNKTFYSTVYRGASCCIDGLGESA